MWKLIIKIETCVAAETISNYPNTKGLEVKQQYHFALRSSKCEVKIKEVER